ncbi:CYFA0S05e03246g1_1 [Cyberlindnera fabianii]|uniref:CYFA0S05e03246g1_1 n=1 Tax=Cyberlindnera fabianii TaxID=36022 RepID=A0A061AZ59_CYBFA|nr:CYFA0S05e03246g1_1 [Cyberlindnera fabianii]
MSQELLLASNVTEVISSSHFLYLLDFLNASRAGFAQKEAGISFQTFLSSLSISLLYCAFQVITFSLLRTRLRNIYQPNRLFTNIIGEHESSPKEGLFSWVVEILVEPISNYKKSGLDAYFFLRYMCFLLFLFLGLAILNIPILIPVNYMSGYQRYTMIDLELYTNGTVPSVEGLDMISMSNIAPKFSQRLSVHLTMAVVSILWFHGLLIIELKNYIEVKNKYLSDSDNFLFTNKLHSYHNTILIQNVPLKLLNRQELTEMFRRLCGAQVQNIWFIYNYGDIRDIYKSEVKQLTELERLLTTDIHRRLFQESTPKIEGIPPTMTRAYWMTVCHNLKHASIEFGNKTYLPTVVFRPLDIPIQEAVKKLQETRHLLKERRARFIKRDNGTMPVYHRYNKVFVQFRDPLHALILNQIQISGHLNELNKTVTLINPRDIIWRNLSIQSNMFAFARVIGGNFLSTCVILGWVIPVAFIGLISQLPYLTALITLLSWMNFLPTYLTDVMSNYLSVVLLMCLSELVPHLFRYISHIKGKITGADVEMDVQRWMFVFLFIHIFLVVTISSGYTVIVEGLVNNPVSIPNILATNLPKCSNFFFSYITIRGLSYFGNNLLQNHELFCNSFVYPWIDWTPREKFERLSKVPEYKWGSVYPTFAVLGSIGLIYCILSPVIVVFCCVAFALVLLSFKYTLKYQYQQKPVSENYGQLYPTALFQLYSGVYFMEACLIGMFALSRDEDGQANCLYHALLTFVLMISTAAGQSQIKLMFGALLTKTTPLMLTRDGTDGDECALRSADISTSMFNDTFYEECFKHYNKIVWMPKDNYSFSLQMITYLSALGLECSNAYCELTDEGEVVINGYPPDYI